VEELFQLPTVESLCGWREQAGWQSRVLLAAIPAVGGALTEEAPPGPEIDVVARGDDRQDLPAGLEDAVDLLEDSRWVGKIVKDAGEGDNVDGRGLQGKRCQGGVQEDSSQAAQLEVAANEGQLVNGRTGAEHLGAVAGVLHEVGTQADAQPQQALAGV